MTTDLAFPDSLLASAPDAGAARPAAVQAPPRRFAAFRRPSMAWLLFLLAVFPLYVPVLGGQFFWDDNFLALGDPLIRTPRFLLEDFRHTLFGDTSQFYRPTQTITYTFDYWCWGLEPFGYHLTNVLIHAFNGFALFLLLRRVLPVLVPAAATTPRPATDRGALAVALLWAVHPVHSAAVAYVSGRADSLAMAFCLMAWLCCERALDAFRPTARVSWGVGALVSLLLGLCSKEIAFVWLVLFGGWLFVLRPLPAATPRAALRTKFTIMGVGLLALLCYVGLRHLPPAAPPPPPYPPMPTRWLLMLRALGDYSRLILFPDELYMERQVFAAPGLVDPPGPAYYAALAAVGVFTLAAFAAGASLPGRGRTLRRAGAVWFLVGFLPISNLFLLNASVAEHWLYLPSIGFLLFLAGVALDVPWARSSAFRARPWIAVTAVIVAVVALGGRTWLRAHDWLDGLTFYRQTIRDGGDTPRIREGLALAYYTRGNLAAATPLLRDLVVRYPHLFSTRVNLATVLLRSGHKEEAHAEFERIAADLDDPANQRGGAREFTATVRALDQLEPPGDPAWAARRGDLLKRTAARFPGSWELARLQISDHERAGDLTGALALATRFVDANWSVVAARLEVGRLQAAAGHTDAALAAWQEAARFDLRDAETPARAADLCLAHDRLDEALAWQQTAVRRQPGSLRQHLLLARVLERQGRLDEAEHALETAARLANANQG